MDQQVNKFYEIEDGSVTFLDDKQLPFKKNKLTISSIDDLYKYIVSGNIVGNVKIAIISTIALALEMNKSKSEDIDELKREFNLLRTYIESIKKELRNLTFSMDELNKAFEMTYENMDELKQLFIKISLANEEYFINSYKSINKTIETMIDKSGVLIIGYSGIEARYEENNPFKWVYIPEKRGNFSGSRLLATSLNDLGSFVHILQDNELGSLFRYNKINKVFVNPEIICRNGDILTGQGGYNGVILAMAHNIPVYVMASKSIYDSSKTDGKFLNIYEDEGNNLLSFEDGKLEGIKVYNPKVDLINNEFITAFINEDGVLMPPYEEKIIKGLGV